VARNLPKLNVSAIPPTREVKGDTDLRQFMAADGKVLDASATKWVQEIAAQVDAEALAAGNPKVRLISINGTTGKNGTSRSGFRPGTIAQASRSVRILYLGDELAQLANKLMPVLSNVIGETFPDSKTKRLSNNWEWWVQRNANAKGGGGKGTRSELLGKTVPKGIGLYDVLWLVPNPVVASYSWFANYNAKKRFGYKYNLTKKTIHEIDKTTNTVVKRKVTRMKKRLRGFASEAARRMRGNKNPSVVVRAAIIAHAMTGPESKSDWGVPAIRVSFRRSLSVPVEN
jgi:hypothetical protein